LVSLLIFEEKRMAQRRRIKKRLIGRVKKMVQDPSEIIIVW